MGKHHPKNKTKMNIPMRIAAVLFCLTLVSTYLVSGLFARYSTSSQSSGNARVARFSIEGGGVLSQSVEAALVPGEAAEQNLIIVNNSEVSVEYKIDVTNVTKNLPLEFCLKKEEGSSSAEETNGAASGNTPSGSTTPDGTTLTDEQLPGSHTDNYILRMEWKAQDDTDKDLALMGMVDYIAVTVTAAQID